MAHLSEIIETHPIRDGLNTFLCTLQSVCEELELPFTVASIRQLDSDGLQNLALDLVSALRALPALRALSSASGRKELFSDVLRLNSTISLEDFDIEWLVSLLTAILDKKSDEIIWNNVKYVDDVLKEELGTLFISVPGFYEAFFGDVEDLEEVGHAVFSTMHGRRDSLI